ncbi:MAG: hypothetical protein OQL19_16590 [Gammaproteobacteria bacterium]|nr:hypothetical protein [Gammaproteobacteria bacterium]
MSLLDQLKNLPTPKPKTMTIGLKDFTPNEIQTAINTLKKEGYKVKHITEGLPNNGVLRAKLNK